MTAEEARAAREALGLSTAQLAREFLVDERNVIAWEKGDVKLPSSLARELDWRAAVALRQAALQQSGLPECDWVQTWEQTAHSNTGKNFKRQISALQQHAAACTVCQSREHYVRSRFPPLPAPPRHPFAEVLVRFNAQVHKLPPWARPIAYGAAIIGTLLTLRLLLMLLGN